jgi:murein DD-endopeptidase MepM/ murein hydrolase activator NlpD
MKQIDVSVGDTVMAGEVVGLSGGGASDKGAGNSKGAHLHFELLDGNRHVNPEKTIKDKKFCPKPN